MITLKDVAKKAGVSTASVSYVVNDSRSVGKEIRQRVLDAVQELGYKPNRTAQAMRTGKTMTIGLVLPDLRNPFFPELAHAVESTAREHDYATFLVDTKNAVRVEADGIDSLIQRGVDGIIWFPVTQNKVIKSPIKDIPMVVLDQALLNYDVVLPDYEGGGRLLANYLLDMGHRRIGIISGPSHADNMKMRRSGFVAAFTEKKGKVIWETENAFSLELNEITKKKILKKGITAIVAGNDMIAIGACKWLNQSGKSVPKDISIVGFDDNPWCEILSPTLTTVRIPLFETASQAVDLLKRRIEKPETARHRIVLDVELIERESVADIN